MMTPPKTPAQIAKEKHDDEQASYRKIGLASELAAKETRLSGNWPHWTRRDATAEDDSDTATLMLGLNLMDFKPGIYSKDQTYDPLDPDVPKKMFKMNFNMRVTEGGMIYPTPTNKNYTDKEFRAGFGEAFRIAKDSGMSPVPISIGDDNANIDFNYRESRFIKQEFAKKLTTLLEIAEATGTGVCFSKSIENYLDSRPVAEQNAFYAVKNRLAVNALKTDFIAQKSPHGPFTKFAAALTDVTGDALTQLTGATPALQVIDLQNQIYGNPAPLLTADDKLDRLTERVDLINQRIEKLSTLRDMIDTETEACASTLLKPTDLQNISVQSEIGKYKPFFKRVQDFFSRAQDVQDKSPTAVVNDLQQHYNDSNAARTQLRSAINAELEELQKQHAACQTERDEIMTPVPPAATAAPGAAPAPPAHTPAKLDKLNEKITHNNDKLTAEATKVTKMENGLNGLAQKFNDAKLVVEALPRPGKP